MTKNRQMTKGEGVLLGLTALFLCFLFTVNARDARSAIRLAAAAVDTVEVNTAERERVYTPTADAATDTAENATQDAATDTAENATVNATPDTTADSTTDTAAAGGNAGKLDLNAAAAKELEALPGIGPELAKRIVEYRREHGPFPSIEAVTEVSGIGEKKFSAMEPYIYVTT